MVKAMKKTILHITLATLGCVCAADTAFAEMAFDGVNVQLGAGMSGTWVNASGTQDNSWEGDSLNLNGTSSAARFNGLASLGYSKAFDSFNLAANVFYVIGNQSANGKSSSDSYTISIPDVYTGSVSEGISSNYKLKNTWGISVEPGYYINSKFLAYLKLAYVNSSLQSSLYCNASDQYCANNTASSNKSINGFGYGVGGKYAITQNIYGAIDLMGVTYGSVSQSYNWFPENELRNSANFKPTQFLGFLSIGYRF